MHQKTKLMKTFLILLLTATLCMALTPEQKATLKSAVDTAKAQGITDTSALLKHLTARPVTGSHEVTTHHVKDALRLSLEQQRNTVLAKYSLATDVAYEVVAATLKAAADAAPDADAKLVVAEDTLVVLGMYTKLKEIAPDGVWNGVAEWDTEEQQPTYADPIIAFGINGNDIEEVQK